MGASPHAHRAPARTGRRGLRPRRGARCAPRTHPRATLDQDNQIGLAHLQAAIALWEYAARSARWVFGDTLGDPVADEIYRALLDEPDGLTSSQLRGPCPAATAAPKTS